MRYGMYQAQTLALGPLRAVSRATATAIESLPAGVADAPPISVVYASASITATTRLHHDRPRFGIDAVETPSGATSVVEEVVDSTPFCDLLHFRKGEGEPGPRVVVLAPLSGHFSTLLRDTVRTLLQDHDVYLTDWHNARDVPVGDGRFGLDDHVELVERFLRFVGPDAHLLAVCQPCVQALAATAAMAEAGDPCTPRSLILMAGPIDTRVDPTSVNELATSKPIEWFERLIESVPRRYEGAGRRVYPGFVQISAFMAMNVRRHLASHLRLFRDLADGRDEQARATREFYDEYFSVLDLPAEFYLETVARVFQTHDLARGALRVAGRTIDPGAITSTALLTIEGERDDICSVGQTMAAHDLCGGLRDAQRSHHLQPGVGHYGVFSGRRWENEIYPVVRRFIDDSRRDRH